jgi:hypothetical protein
LQSLFLILNSTRNIKMRKVALLAGLALVSLPAIAETLSCDALKARVDAKLQEKGVQSYTLEVMTRWIPLILHPPWLAPDLAEAKRLEPVMVERNVLFTQKAIKSRQLRRIALVAGVLNYFVSHG